jgi:hypothetical protein
MMNEKFQVELSEEFLPYLICLPGANPEETLRIVLAIVLLMMMLIELDEAIMLSGQSTAHFNELFRFLTHELVQVVAEKI